MDFTVKVSIKVFGKGSDYTCGLIANTDVCGVDKSAIESALGDSLKEALNKFSAIRKDPDEVKTGP